MPAGPHPSHVLFALGGGGGLQVGLQQHTKSKVAFISTSSPFVILLCLRIYICI